MIKVIGAEDVRRVLNELPKKLSDSAIGAANMKAAKIVVDKEKMLAPEGPTGNLVDSIGAYRSPKKSERQAGSVIVGPRRRGKYKGYAGHLVEYGTRNRQTKKGANRGVMPKKPFAKPAFIQTKAQVIERIRIELAKSIEKALKRYNTINSKASAL